MQIRQLRLLQVNVPYSAFPSLLAFYYDNVIAIAHVWYIKILTQLQGFRVKIANFLLLHSRPLSAIPTRDLGTKNTKPKLTRKLQNHVRILINISNVGY